MAEFKKGDRIFGHNIGEQCVAMSLASIVYNHIIYINIWGKSILNILFTGNNLHDCICRFVKDLLLLTYVPEMGSINNDIYHLQYSE